MCFLTLHRQRFQTIYYLHLQKDARGYKKHSFSKKQQDSSLLRVNSTLCNSIFSLFRISINIRKISDNLKFHTNAPHGVEPLLLITPCNPGTKSIRDNTFAYPFLHLCFFSQSDDSRVKRNRVKFLSLIKVREQAKNHRFSPNKHKYMFVNFCN